MTLRPEVLKFAELIQSKLDQERDNSLDTPERLKGEILKSKNYLLMSANGKEKLDIVAGMAAHLLVKIIYGSNE